MSFYYDPPSWNLCLPHTYFTVDRCLANPSNLSKNPLKRLQRGSFYTNQLKITLAGALRDLKKEKNDLFVRTQNEKPEPVDKQSFFGDTKSLSLKGSCRGHRMRNHYICSSCLSVQPQTFVARTLQKC